jgi:citrate lyase beta subunit
MSESKLRPRRSLIFAPGIKPEMFPKACKSGADIVCIDLEDAIAPDDKDAARARTLELFEDLGEIGRVEPIVRINSPREPDGLKDLLAIIESKSPPQALMLPKVKSAEEVKLLDELLAPHHPQIRFHVIIETNEGLAVCRDIAKSSERIDSLLFGGVDMSAELRVEAQWQPLLYARQRLVHAAAGASLDLIDVPWLDLDDADGLADEAAASRALGFTGKASIHHKQIATINECFSPDPEAVARARRIVGAFEEADGGLVVIDGKLIEKPVLRSMYRILAVAEVTDAPSSN